MKHNTMSDSIPLICGLALLANFACSSLPSASVLKSIDCQYHVLEKAFNEQEELIDAVLDVGQGPFQIDEFVDVAVKAGKSDLHIIEYGKQLNKCLPDELKNEAPVEELVSSYRSNMVL